MARSQLRLLRVRIVAFTLVDMHTHAQHVHCVFAKDFTASAWPWPQSLSMMNLLVDITSFWSSTLQAPATIVQGVRRMSCSDTRAADTERAGCAATDALEVRHFYFVGGQGRIAVMIQLQPKHRHFVAVGTVAVGRRRHEQPDC